MEIISESIIQFIDESIEKRGTSRGIAFTERRLKHLTLHFKTSTKPEIISRYLLENFDQFENLLRRLGYLKEKEAIGAYNIRGKLLTLYIVSRSGKVLLM